MILAINQRDSEEYQAASKLWVMYLQTRNDFLQSADGEDDDEDGEEMMDNPGVSTEDEVSLVTHCFQPDAMCMYSLSKLKANIHFSC